MLRRHDDGFTLVELVVVVAIVGLLMMMGMASYRVMVRDADEKGTQLDLLTATKVQELHYLEQGAFSDDVGVLMGLEPTLRYTSGGDPPGSVVVSIEAGRSALDVCLFARTGHGEWFGVLHSATDGDRYARSAPVPCGPGNTATWSTASW